jgi:hypothetical protein
MGFLIHSTHDLPLLKLISTGRGKNTAAKKTMQIAGPIRFG